LFLHCRVRGDQEDVAQVAVNYTDELGGGNVQSATGTARIRFTDSQAAVDQSINRAVYAEKELMLTAVAKDEALKQADGGNYRAAASILAAQKATLHAAFAGAPAGVQSQVSAETDNLQDFSDQLNSGAYSGAARKALQAQSYNTRNSK
jgi:hypothetical protein